MKSADSVEEKDGQQSPTSKSEEIENALCKDQVMISNSFEQVGKSSFAP